MAPRADYTRAELVQWAERTIPVTPVRGPFWETQPAEVRRICAEELAEELRRYMVDALWWTLQHGTPIDLDVIHPSEFTAATFAAAGETLGDAPNPGDEGTSVFDEDTEEPDV